MSESGDVYIEPKKLDTEPITPSIEPKNLAVEQTETLDSDEPFVEEKNADNTLSFMEKYGHLVTESDLNDKELERRVSRKNYIYLLPLLMAINTILFIDKSVISYATLLDFFTSVNINDDQYDNSNSIFYTGYLVGQIPLNFLLQKYNFGKLLSLILFIWALIVFLTCLVTNYGGLICVRFFLGFTESVITPALEITLLQFFTPDERRIINPIFWTSCVGISVIVAGFISYGLLYSTSSIPPWKFFMIITGGMTLLNAIWALFIYPSDTSKARFLTIKERVFLIKKIQRASKSSISQNVVKVYQIKECFTDPVSWLFFWIAFCLMIANNLGFQQNLLYTSLGVDNLGSTLVNVAGGGFSSAVMLAGSLYTYFRPNSTALISIISIIPALAGSIAMITIPYEKKLALVAMLVLTGNTFGLAYICVLGWATSSVSGYTKKFYRNIMFMLGYGISNIISPQIWRGNQKPRYYPAWIVQIVISFGITPILIAAVHVILSRRNKERLRYIAEHPDEKGQVIRHTDSGEIVESVDVAYLDLTDLENKLFIYPL